MANDQYKPDPSEEEYHFSDEETPSYAAPAAGDTSAAPMGEAQPQRKRFLIIIAVIIGIFCIYKLIDVLLTSRAHRLPVTTTTTTPTPVLTPTLPAPTQMPVAPVQQPEVMATPENERLGNLEKQTNDLQTSVQQINGQISSMQSAITDLNNQIANLTTSIQTLTVKVADEQIVKAAVKPATEIRARRVHVIELRPVCFVRAMIQGRAWLSTAGGGTMTVGVGDTIPGYGTVVSINTSQGLVMTSSGAIIGYSPQDS
jgi:intracellular multiplication protein IcmG